MQLPNIESVYIDVAKLRDYSLNLNHGRGQHKARVFIAALGLTADDIEELREAILLAIIQHDAVLGEQDDYGQRYTVDFPLTRSGKKATIRTAWIVRWNENFPRLTSCYVLKER